MPLTGPADERMIQLGGKRAPRFSNSTSRRTPRRHNRRVTHIPITERWVATRDSAKQAADAFLMLTLRRRRCWVFFVAVELVLALRFALSFDERYGPATRLFWGPVYALVPTLVIAVLTLGIGHLLNRRYFRGRLREGVVLESGIGERALVLRGPWSESTLSFDGIASVRSSGNWVFLQQIGVPLLGAWPAELFPPADLARLEHSVETRKVVSARES